MRCMKNPFKPKYSSSKNKRYAVIITTVWTGLLLAIDFIDSYINRQDILREARINAIAAYEKDIVYRRWNSDHGGVYVPVTEKTKPNPYLDVERRDVTTKNGEFLTLMNPAYMTRQVHELDKEAYGIRGHITSLNPIRPQNAPDPWETAALKSFQLGNRERWKDDAESKEIKINIQKELADLLSTVGSAAELREVIVNLINNAIDAMPQGGDITIKTFSEDR